jgi:DNA-binding NarL/FixJ family response regulator
MLVDSFTPSPPFRVPSEPMDNRAGIHERPPVERGLRVAKSPSAGGWARGSSDRVEIGGLRVPSLLCVDDDDDNIAALTEDLSGHPYVVEFAPNGEIGLARILAKRPDLIVCSMWMQGGSGLELLRGLHEAGPEFANIPFVFLVCRPDRESELAGRRLGADDYLSKPVDFDMLRIVVDNRLRRRSGRRAPAPQMYLTSREKEVLTWVGRGKTSAEIAIILGLSERTVNFHCDGAMKRLDVINRTQAVATAIWHGSISI